MKLPFNPDSKTARYVALFIVLCITAWATKCHSEGLAVSGGQTLLRGPAGVLQVEWQWLNFQGRDAHWETGITMIGPSTYGHMTMVARDEGQSSTTPLEWANNFVWDATYVDGFGPVDIGIGPAFMQNTDAYNHEGANFHLMLGWHHKRLFVRYNHFSNAGTKAPNLGRDMLLVGYVL
jgi:hypothetical protein